MAKLIAGVTETTYSQFVCSDGRLFKTAKLANGWQRQVNTTNAFAKLVQDTNLPFRSNPYAMSVRSLMVILRDPKLTRKLTMLANK